MSERRKDIVCILAFLLLLVLVLSKILFTDKIIRAPDIIAEFYWGVKGLNGLPFRDLFALNLAGADWDLYTNSGFTNEGGGVAGHFLILQKLIFWIFPLPVNIAWFIVFCLFFGAAGVYFCCRLIGASRVASFIGAVIFALSPELVSLINAGHVIKIATITYAPWAFWSLEKSFQTRRIFWFMFTSMILAFQFFGGHWQVAYYTCLCVGVYGVLRLTGILVTAGEERRRLFSRLIGMNIILLLFFLTTVSISLLPLANWSKETNRGVSSGANQGKGGLDREEAMSWSMPPEELGAFVIPGFFGLSRQEGGPNPTNIKSYYWGRMVFTQTISYMGLLPWLLVPLPLIFRRDRYTWLAAAGIAGCLLFSMGKYTPFYNLLYDHFPGINRFRVPKMIMFIPVIGLGVLSARGIDLLMDAEARASRAFRRYLAGVVALPVLLLVFLTVLHVWRDAWITVFIENLARPTRLEQGMYLISQRWNNLVLETGIAALLATLTAAVIVFGSRMKGITRFLPVLLLLMYLADVWRVNDKFLFLTDAPEKAKQGETSPLISFLKTMPLTYRILPMDGSDPMQYVSQHIPVMYTSNPVQHVRWQQFLDGFNVVGPMPDIVNVKYLIVSKEEYQNQMSQLGQKYVPVFTPPGSAAMVLENRSVLPKGWLIPSVAVVSYPSQRLAILQDPMFNPLLVGMVESPPPLALMEPTRAQPLPQNVTATVYEGQRISLTASTPVNALLVLGEKYYRGWKAVVDGKSVEIVPVNHILRGVYLTPGNHKVEFVFDPLPFKIGKYLTLGSFALFAAMLVRERLLRRRGPESLKEG